MRQAAATLSAKRPFLQKISSRTECLDAQANRLQQACERLPHRCIIVYYDYE
jgi:hypothetical protein